jgi:hypothetical protein
MTPEIKALGVCAVGAMDSTFPTDSQYQSMTITWGPAVKCFQYTTATRTVYGLLDNSTCPFNTTCCDASNANACNAPNGLATALGVPELEKTKAPTTTKNGPSNTPESNTDNFGFTYNALTLVSVIPLVVFYIIN